MFKCPVWPDGNIICSIFGHLQQLKFAQWRNFFQIKARSDLSNSHAFTQKGSPIFYARKKCGELENSLSHCVLCGQSEQAFSIDFCQMQMNPVWPDG